MEPMEIFLGLTKIEEIFIDDMELKKKIMTLGDAKNERMHMD